MSYRQLLLGRWSRRDRLAVVVVAVAVAFLVGTVMLVTAAGAQTTTIAQEYQATATVTSHDSLAEADAAAGVNATVVPFSVIDRESGPDHYVVARTAALSLSQPDEGPETTRGSASGPTEETLDGPQSTVTVEVAPQAGSTTVPAEWYITSRDTVEELGVSGVFVVHPVADGGLPSLGVPLRAALAFFVFGTREALGTLMAVAGGSAVLVGVVVYSVTRISVRDRRRTIQTIRATGGPARTVLGLFGLRALLLTGMGIAVGYAVGVIAVNTAVNAAVFLGVPTALNVVLSWRAVTLIAPLCGVLLGVGLFSGGLAALPAVRGGPLESTTWSLGSRIRGVQLPQLLTPQLLDIRTIIPTTATLTTFVAFVVLVTAIGGVVGPLTASDDATITEPESPHPIASTVPSTYADALEQQGINASPEILLFETRDGQSYTARGANFTAFTSVSDATLATGRAPQDSTEAVIGQSLARTLDITPGETITLGGLTREKLTRVTIVGTFRAPGPLDDQLIVPLQTAQHLADKPDSTVQFIRAERLPEDSTVQPGFRVTAVDAPTVTPPNESFETRVTVSNGGSSAEQRSITVNFEDQTVTRQVELGPGETTVIAVSMQAGTPGTYQIDADGTTQAVEVAPQDAVRLKSLPSVAPPNSTVYVDVTSPYGDPISGATVSVGDNSTNTSEAGRARVSLPSEEGSATIHVTHRGESTTNQIEIREGAERRVSASVNIAPRSPDLLTRPTARVTIANPWAVTINREVQLETPDGRSSESITVEPGAERTLEETLQRRPPGTYELRAFVDGESADQLSYRVTGDERIAAAIASGGVSGGSGIGQAIETAFGNLRVVLAVILALAGVMTVGGTTATFAGAVHAERTAIGVFRATGAGPRRILTLVCLDALRLGIIASVLACCLGIAALQMLRTIGLFTVFGVELNTIPSPAIAGGILLGGLLLTEIGAVLATVTLLRASPATVLRQASNDA